MKAILFDLDGVFYQGNEPIAGAHEVISWVNKKKIPYLFITNTTSRPRSVLVTKLANFGINTDEAHILTPPVAAALWLKSKQVSENVVLFIPEATKQEFAGFSLLDDDSNALVSAVVVGDLGGEWDFDKMNRAFRYLNSFPHPLFVALGMTRYWRAEDGLRLDAGPFVVALEYASGIKPVVLGKPASAFFLAALDYLNVNAAEAVMIGDDIHGDIEGAQQAGLSALLVKTGKYREIDLDKGIRPDAVLESVLDLTDWWDSQMEQT